MEKVQKNGTFHISLIEFTVQCVCLYVHACILYMWMLIQVYVHACRGKKSMSRIFHDSPLPSSFLNHLSH